MTNFLVHSAPGGSPMCKNGLKWTFTNKIQKLKHIHIGCTFYIAFQHSTYGKTNCSEVHYPLRKIWEENEKKIFFGHRTLSRIACYIGGSTLPRPGSVPIYGVQACFGRVIPGLAYPYMAIPTNIRGTLKCVKPTIGSNWVCAEIVVHIFISLKYQPCDYGQATAPWWVSPYPLTGPMPLPVLNDKPNIDDPQSGCPLVPAGHLHIGVVILK